MVADSKISKCLTLLQNVQAQALYSGVGMEYRFGVGAAFSRIWLGKTCEARKGWLILRNLTRRVLDEIATKRAYNLVANLTILLFVSRT